MSARGFTVENRRGARILRTISAPEAVSARMLPEPALDALASIADDLRHLPNDCIVDRAELIHWLNRMARRVDGVAAMKAPVPKRESPLRNRHGNSHNGRALSVREVAESVFGKPPTASVPGRNTARTIITRRGRSVRVETRRARANGQLDLWS